MSTTLPMRLRLVLVAVIVASALALAPRPTIRAFAASATIRVGAIAGAATVSDPVRGNTTVWRLSVKSVRSLYRLPGVSSSQYYKGTHWMFYVLMLNISNIGDHAAAPVDDLYLAMKVLPQYFTLYTPGWGSWARQKPYDTWTRQAVAHLGGTPPWIAAKPGETLTYCYVFLTVRGDHHYGLYNAPPQRPYKLLVSLGV